MPQDSDLEFRTKDLALAAYLCCEGYSFLRIERQDGSRLKDVVFDQDDELGVAVEDYKAGHALVEPLTFQKKVHWLRNKMNPDGRKRRDGSGS